ncbi:MAG: GNAT family N-acetyltransferase [Casimicrobiaceae bacterium]
MRTLRTARLTLEPQVAAHAGEMFAVLSDPAIYEHENEPPSSVEWLHTRYAQLESRQSPDGSELWLNWILRLASAEPIGYVQATVYQGSRAAIAYELSSKHWHQGLATEAIRSMIEELIEQHQVKNLSAVLKKRNDRSLRLLERLRFSIASPEAHAQLDIEPDELLMTCLARDITPRAKRDCIAETGTEIVLRKYFHAKDENRPHLLDEVFSPDATLEIHNRSSAIAFSAVTQGRQSIADVLVRDFGRAYENVYSFYMERPLPDARRFTCDWLVAMSVKDAGGVRVGFGGYDWVFEEQYPFLATRLAITIEAMLVLPAERFAAVRRWIEGLDYPWSSGAAVVAGAPAIPELSPVLLRLERGHAGV